MRMFTHDRLENTVLTILIYVLPHFILMKPYWVSISSDKLVWIHTLNCRRPLYTFLLTIDENGHVLFLSSFLFGLFRRGEFSFRLGHTHQSFWALFQPRRRPEYSKRSSLRRSEMFIDTHFDDVPSPFGGAERILEDTTLVDFRSSERS